MLVAAAACPCPPLLVPEVAAGAAPELDTARAACTDALGVLAAARPDLLVVVGPDAGTCDYPAGTPGSFRGFGVDLDVRLGDGGGDRDGAGDGVAGRELPYGLAVGAWLLGRTGWAGAPVEGRGVVESLAPDACLAEGGGLAGRADRVALLVMGTAAPAAPSRRPATWTSVRRPSTRRSPVRSARPTRRPCARWTPDWRAS